MKKYVLILIILLHFYATKTICQSTIRIPDTTIQLSNSKLTDSLSFGSEYNWTCESNQDWLSSTPTSGNADSNISLKVSATSNVNNLARGGWVKISNGFDEHFLHITQQAAENPLFYQYTSQSTSSTLSNNIVNDVLEDREGGVWFATDYGVSLYKDGQWQSFTKVDGLYNNHVTTILEANNGDIWFGTHDGITVYSNGKWKVLEDYYSVNDLLLLDDGTYWIATWRYCWEIDPSGGHMPHGTENGMTSGYGNSFCLDNDGFVWVGTNMGVSKKTCSFFTDTVCWENYDQNDGILGTQVNDIVCDEPGNIWVGTNNGLSKFDGVNWHQEAYFTVKDMIFDTQNNLLLASTNGFYEISGNTTTHYTMSDGLVSNETNCIEVDDQNNKWIGTGQGVSYYNGNTWTNYQSNGLIHNNIVTIEIDDNDQKIIGFGSWQKGLSVFNDTTWNNTGFEVNDHINDILIDEEKNTWFATMHGAVLKRNDNSTKTYTTSDGLENSVIRSVYQDYDGHIWFATNNGISKLANNTITNYLNADGFYSNWIYTITNDLDSNIWCGGQNGLYCMNDTNWTTYTTADGLLSNQIKDIAVDSNGNVWVVNGLGVSVKSDTGWVHHNIYDQYNSQPICIETDKTGKIWIGLVKGYLTYYNGQWHRETMDDHFNFSVKEIKFDSKGHAWIGTGGDGLIKLPVHEYVNVSPTNFYKEAEADSISFIIASNTSWKITCDADWLSFNTTEGVDTSTIIAHFDTNNSHQERTALIQVIVNNTDTTTLVLTQNFKVVENNRIVAISIEETACKIYTSPSGKYTWINSGTYYDTIACSNGCDSIIEIDLTIKNIDKRLIQSGSSIMPVIQFNGDAYQWLDCDNHFTPIENATSPLFTANKNGNYAVEISSRGCVDTSECVEVSMLDVLHNDLGENFTIYPNPANTEINISILIRQYQDTKMIIYNMLGIPVIEQRLDNNTNMIDISDLSKGIFVVKIVNGMDLIYTKQLIVR